MGDPDIRSVVVVGNGIAGIAAVKHARRLHPGCEIHVISRANDTLSKRKGIARLINGRSGIHGPHLRPESWYQEQRIINWSNTHAVGIDTDKRQVMLATKDHVAYDRLILANGSSDQIPAIDGFGTPGSFVLRGTDDATGIGDYVQRYDAHTAIVAGASVLGLEAAHYLKMLGLEVIVLSDAEHLLNRQLDTCSSRLLQRQLRSQGIEILTGTEAATLYRDDDGRVNSVGLKDGRVLPTDVVLACTSVRPNADLAKTAGIATRRGILVDDYMQTSHADIYAAGDVAEHDGVTFCRQPFAVEQGEIAAFNALGGKQLYRGHIPSTLLNLTGIDLLSIGQIDTNSNGVYSIVDEQPGCFKYRKLIFTAGHLLGAILIGYPDDASLVSDLVKRGADLTPVISSLHSGNWNALTRLEITA